MSLVEVVVAMGVSSLSVASIVLGYMFVCGTANKSALSLAASARALERVEQMRSAKWDTSSWPVVDQLVASNFAAEVVTLDLSDANGLATYATNFTTISQISSNPPLKKIRVDCVWNFRGLQLLTNTIETCRAPDQ
jgi:type II secretory pathway pseudopilin PulG